MEEQVKDLTPKSLEEIVSGLQGFGIEENEEILTVKASGKTVNFRISNMCPEEETKALIAAEDLKGHAWMHRIKCEILSRAVTYLNGVTIRTLPQDQRYVKHPVTGEQVDIQVALRDTLLGWGNELVGVLWKVLMVHSQGIEDRIFEQFPDSSVMTDVERRFMAQAMQEVEEASRVIIEDAVAKLDEPEAPSEEKK